MTTTEITTTREITGSTYDRQSGGAPCPACGHPRAKVLRTLPWEDGVRVRYHTCPACRVRFKSLEDDRAAPPAPQPEPPRGFRHDPGHPLRRTG